MLGVGGVDRNDPASVVRVVGRVGIHEGEGDGACERGSGWGEGDGQVRARARAGAGRGRASGRLPETHQDTIRKTIAILLVR